MPIPVFLSYPQPINAAQEGFVKSVRDYLESRGFVGRTLGVTEYDMDAPLRAIRRLMIESNGLITIAFARTFVEKGTAKPDSADAVPVDGSWFTSPWAQIEPAMAYQIGLPILIFREKRVVAEGVLEKGVVGMYMPAFNLEAQPADYFRSLEWNSILGQWEGLVRRVVAKKGNPPELY
jgi:hypothetical protein